MPTSLGWARFGSSNAPWCTWHGQRAEDSARDDSSREMRPGGRQDQTAHTSGASLPGSWRSCVTGPGALPEPAASQARAGQPRGALLPAGGPG